MASTKTWHLYLIENSYQQLYTGITTDVERRYQEHQQGGPKAAKSLKGKGPLQLRFKQTVGEHGLALRLERKVKALPRVKKQALINGDLCLSELINV